MSLFISINTASSAHIKSPIDDAITFIAAHATIEKKQGGFPNGPILDVTFLLPGEYEQPAFTGMRMGGYTKESDTLFFETAVPKHILQSEEASHYVAVVMQDVVEHAQEFFLENQIMFDTAKWRQAIARLTKTDAVSALTH